MRKAGRTSSAGLGRQDARHGLLLRAQGSQGGAEGWVLRKGAEAVAQAGTDQMPGRALERESPRVW